MPFSPMAQSFGLCGTRSSHERCQKWLGIMVTGRSTYITPYIPFFSFLNSCHIECLLIVYHPVSMKLGEENRRIKAARASGDSLPDRPPSRAASVDDEASIIAEPTKANSSCGACRTRESEVWWKAPKGLVTNVLCDNCGISWRKYADLNVRPFREETISKGGKNADKREGTPLTAPAPKRARVSILCSCAFRVFLPCLVFLNP